MTSERFLSLHFFTLCHLFLTVHDSRHGRGTHPKSLGKTNPTVAADTRRRDGGRGERSDDTSPEKIHAAFWFDARARARRVDGSEDGRTSGRC